VKDEVKKIPIRAISSSDQNPKMRAPPEHCPVPPDIV
jgi:hypothetical protein